jgi:threonine dehydratase
MNINKEILEAEKRIRKHVRETPTDFSPYLSRIGDCMVYLKLENFQATGSFKLRGATNKLLSLSKDDLLRGIVTRSTGNHGAAVAYLCRKFSCNGIIYMPENAAQSKIDALRLDGVDVKLQGRDCNESHEFAVKSAEKNNQVFIHPYDDVKIIGGQGTIGIELTRQIERIDTVLVPVGGGGLISGIAAYLKSISKNIEIIGCQPKNAPAMYKAIKAGRVIEIETKPSISDATGDNIIQGNTFDICRKYVDDFTLLTEEEIKEAIRLVLEKHYMLIEGAAALTVASFVKEKERFRDKTVVLILSGSKIGLNTLQEFLFKGE